MASGTEPLEFRLTHEGGMNRRIEAAGWTDDSLTPTTAQVDELETKGWARVPFPAMGKNRDFVLTDEGRKVADASSSSASPAPAVDLNWAAVTPTLERIVEEYERRGAPEMGILPPNAGPATAPHIRELVRLELVEEVALFDQDENVRPTRRALEFLRGWPGTSGEAVLELLLASLDTRIEQTNDEEERSTLIRVRDGLAGVARDVFVGVLTRQAGDAL